MNTTRLLASRKNVLCYRHFPCTIAYRSSFWPSSNSVRRTELNYGASGLLGCNAVPTGFLVLPFRRIVVTSSSGTREVLDTEDGVGTLLRNAGNF